MDFKNILRKVSRPEFLKRPARVPNFEKSPLRHKLITLLPEEMRGDDKIVVISRRLGHLGTYVEGAQPGGPCVHCHNKLWVAPSTRLTIDLGKAVFLCTHCVIEALGKEAVEQMAVDALAKAEFVDVGQEPDEGSGASTKS